MSEETWALAPKAKELVGPAGKLATSITEIVESTCGTPREKRQIVLTFIKMNQKDMENFHEFLSWFDGWGE